MGIAWRLEEVGSVHPAKGEIDMSRPLMFGIGGVILGLVLLAVLPWWVSALVIVAAIAIPVVAWRSLDPAQRRRIRSMRSRGQLGR
jgi:Flp pilus assembly protein TadB